MKVEETLGRLKLQDLPDMPHVEGFAIRTEVTHGVPGQPVGRHHKKGSKDDAPQGKVVAGQPTKGLSAK
jgi:hypothetical protein